MGLSLLLLALAARAPEAALVDDRWAERRSHAGALAMVRTMPIPNGAPAARLHPYGPVYRLPVGGKATSDDTDLLIAASPADTAIAPASGRVAYAGRFRRYGQVLILDHGHGWTSVLTGLSRIDVPQGTALSGGEPIGRPGGHVRVRLLHHGRGVDVAKMIAVLAR